MSEKSALRKEYDRMRFDGTLARECGSECVNCGSDESIEYHHIVPLILGGTNNVRNIVPLCHRCHKAAHGSHHIQRYIENPNAGRKPKIPDEEAFPILDRWLDGQFGNRKLKELLNLNGSTHPNATVQYKRWCADRGIKSVRSNYDIAMTSSYEKLCDSYVVGRIYFLDGTEKYIAFNDLGENDDVEYDFCAGFRREKKQTMTWGEMKQRMHSQRRDAIRNAQKERSASTRDIPEWFVKYRSSLKQASGI